MRSIKVSPIIKWWVTPKLPYHDIFELPLLVDKSLYGKTTHLISQWLVHPIKRRLARWYLRMLQSFTDIKVIGVTGSAGKSTTVQMIVSTLSLKGKTLSTPPGIDSVYSIPNIILKCLPGTKYLILEMSVEYPGEMDYYLWLAKPDVGVITNIYPTHTKFFGDVGGVFREKSKLAKALSSNSWCVLNGGDKQLHKLGNKLKAKIVWFGNGTEVMSSREKITKDYKAYFKLIFDQSPEEQIGINLPNLGRQFIENALAASAVAKILQIPRGKIKKGLENFETQEHRMKVIKHKKGALILDDSYNNNPQAAVASLETFKELANKRRKVIVFGDMLELGNWEKKYHIQLGEFIGKVFPDKLICVGEASTLTAVSASKLIGEFRVISVSSWKEALSEVKKEVKSNTIILIKGSRSIGLDNLVSALL